MKKQLTAVFMLATMGWSVTTLANELQATQLQPVNTAMVSVEISIDQPVLDIESSIINQVNETLQQHSKTNLDARRLSAWDRRTRHTTGKHKQRHTPRGKPRGGLA